MIHKIMTTVYLIKSESSNKNLKGNYFTIVIKCPIYVSQT